MQITTNKSDKTLKKVFLKLKKNMLSWFYFKNRYFLIDKEFFELQNKIEGKNMKFEVTMT